MTTAGTDGDLFWRILQNDLRLWWRGNATKKAAWAGGIVGRLLLLLVFHFAVWAMIGPFGEGVRGGPEFVCLVALSMLAMSTTHRSLEVLYNRGDLSLLLSSPVPPRIVLRTRLADITATSMFDTLMIVLPIVDVAMFAHGTRWAWGFVVWFGAVLVVAPAAVLLTILAVERIGARRARTALQVFGLVFGLLTFVATQLPQWLRMSRMREGRSGDSVLERRELFAWFDVPPLQQLAAAAAGAWHWAVLLVGAGALLFFLAQRMLALRFTHGAQGAAADVGGGTRAGSLPASAWQNWFRRPRTRVLVRTQLLLLRRDPLLLMRCAMQIVSIVPMMFGALMFQPAAGVGGVALMAAGIVPMQLAAMRNANDDGLEFEVASPMRSRERAWIRALAVASPFVVLVLIVAVVLVAMNAPLQAALVAVAGTVNALAAGWLATCTTRVHTAEERARNRAPRIVWQVFVGMLIAAVGTAGIGMVVTPKAAIGWLLFAIALGLAALAFVVPPPRRTLDA